MRVAVSIKEQLREQQGSMPVKTWIERQRSAAQIVGVGSVGGDFEQQVPTSAPWEDAITEINIHVRQDGIDIRDRYAAQSPSRQKHHMAMQLLLMMMMTMTP